MKIPIQGRTLSRMKTLAPRQSSRDGFSLLELLMVVAIISLLSSLLVPALGALSGANVRSASAQLSGVFEQARATAVAKNIPVYVGLSQVDAQTVLIGVGSSPSGDAGLADAVSTYRPVALKNVKLLSPGEVRSAVSLPLAAPDADTVTESNFGSLKVNYDGRPVSCSYIVGFTPNGQATVKEGNASRHIQVGLAPANQSSSKDLSLVEISGLTGKVSIFLP